MTVTVANLPYDFTPTAQAQSNQGFMFKNAHDAWFYANSTATATQITDINYPGTHTYTVTLTSSSTTATATTSVNPHGLSVNDSVTISGATQTEYNGTYTVKTVPAANTFTYTFAGSATTPATGTISAVGGKVLVRGIAFLDNYFFVMDTNATIWNCALNDATTWSGLNFITADIEPGAGVALFKMNDYVVALKTWSTEFFYDAGNSPGSPLSAVVNKYNMIGCASGDSLAEVNGVRFWISQTKQKGRSISTMVDLQSVEGQAQLSKVSNPDIDRIVNLSTLATVYSMGLQIGGHAFYILTLVDLNITLAFDMITNSWAIWTSLEPGTAKSVTSITLSGTTATVTATAHGVSDGDPVNIAGANQAAYNGIKVISYVDANTFTFQTTAGTTTPATGTITATPYTETYFKYVSYIKAFDKDLVQHETDGTLCEISELAFYDVGNPIKTVARSGKIDGGTNEIKTFGDFAIIGNKVSGTAYVRFSDDDYVTYSKFRPVDLSATRSILHRCGSAIRRSVELRYFDNTQLQLSQYDIDAS